ncbi:MAG: TIGR04348 family glycosyltransferase [Planctomycetes bacterium]|nr:TIGR04348 family glycosyltransferase [Planctomycetota bacterium]
MTPERRPPRIFLATPAPAGTRLGNRITAARWSAHLRALGARVTIGREWRGERCDLLVALHARKSARSVSAFRAAHPNAPIVVAITGTDVYGPRGLGPSALRSLVSADRIVVLQPEALRALPRDARAKARVLLQSATPHPGRVARAHDGFVVVAAAHLRAVKDPLLAARAVRRLAAGSRVRVEHYGAALDARLAQRARRTERMPADSRSGARWRWLGDRPHAELLRALRVADAFVQTSRSEGGSAALAEAIVSGLPILATRIPASVGMLGARHRGLFAPGDVRALARLLERVETEPSFRRELARASRRLAPRFAPARERAGWRALLSELALL